MPISPEFMALQYPGMQAPDEEQLNLLTEGDVVKVHIAGLRASGVRAARLKQKLEDGLFLAELFKVGEHHRKVGYVAKVDISNVISVIEETPNPSGLRGRETSVPRGAITGGFDLAKAGSEDTVKWSTYPALPPAPGQEVKHFGAKEVKRCWIKDQAGRLIKVRLTKQQGQFLWGFIIGLSPEASEVYQLETQITFTRGIITQWL